MRVLRLIVAALLLAGCAPAGLTPIPAPAPQRDGARWPGRWGTFENGARGVIHEDARIIADWQGGRVPNGAELSPDLAEFEHLIALEEASTEPLPEGIDFEVGGCFVIQPAPGEHASAAGEHRQYLTFVSGEMDESTGRLKLQRTWFTFAEPEGRAPRGLAVLMSGMFATPRDVVDRAERGLLLRGWAVLRMLAPPSRTTERTVYTIPLDAPSDEAMRLIAADLDNRVAESAYAVRAAAAHVVRGSEALARGPRVIIGMSGSGIALPTIVADEPGAYDAAVIVAGGANSFSIARRSSYRDWIDSLGFEFTPREPTGAELAALDAAYLRFSRLDGAHTAGEMSSVPTLMIHGSTDTAVPADSGDLLYEKLGSVERWAMPVGHELVFAALPVRLVALLDWLESKTSEPAL